MGRKELIQLRELVNSEVNRRKRIKELLESELVLEYLEITKTNPVELDIDNMEEIINTILSSFKITKTNGIYVCTGAWYVTYSICYEDTEYYTQYVDINSGDAESKKYVDIESGESFIARRDEERYGEPLISNFEANNIILNPYNTCKNENGYEEVKFDFFETALKDGQAKAKKLVLAKYPRI